MLSQDVVEETTGTTSCGPGREYSVSVLCVKRLFLGSGIGRRNGALDAAGTPPDKIARTTHSGGGYKAAETGPSSPWPCR